MSVIGAPLTRVDAQLKATGTSKYAAEFSATNTAYAVIVQSTIPNGRVASMDTSRTERAAGVVAILTPQKCS
jgi:xanthine dehydrogenase YagR molybdenum-binding subunit